MAFYPTKLKCFSFIRCHDSRKYTLLFTVNLFAFGTNLVSRKICATKGLSVCSLNSSFCLCRLYVPLSRQPQTVSAFMPMLCLMMLKQCAFSWSWPNQKYWYASRPPGRASRDFRSQTCPLQLCRVSGVLNISIIWWVGSYGGEMTRADAWSTLLAYKKRGKFFCMIS